MFVSEVLLTAKKFLRGFAASWEWKFDIIHSQHRNDPKRIVEAIASHLCQAASLPFSSAKAAWSLRKPECILLAHTGARLFVSLKGDCQFM